MAAYMTSVFPLGFAYAALFALIWHKRPGLLRVFCAPGRMALTNYLSQTAIGIALFYGVGLGLLTQWNFFQLTAAALFIFAAQAVFSALWLRFFQFGPAEWLWRCLTYGKWLPIRTSQSAALLKAGPL